MIDFDYEEHERELDQQGDDRVYEAIAYTERENENLHRAIKTFDKNREELVAVILDLQKENEKLQERSEWLFALELAGVDNWEGYGHAYEILEEQNENKDTG